MRLGGGPSTLHRGEVIRREPAQVAMGDSNRGWNGDEYDRKQMITPTIDSHLMQQTQIKQKFDHPHVGWPHFSPTWRAF